MSTNSAEGELEAALYYAIGDFITDEEGKLSLRCGDEVKLLEKVNDTWWWVEVNGEVGYAPANHLSSEQPVEEDAWQNDEYFSSYDALKLHLEMLSDRPRTLAYCDAICNAKSFIEGKVVLDLGCGTGILSLFCAKLGNANKVYAVDASDITKHATEIIEHNDLSDKIEVIQSRGEELQLPEKVDLIVSEWMGTLLLFELMVESVLLTRDRCLKQDGVMWPSTAELFLVPCSAAQSYTEKVNFWEDVYGFDFSPMIPIANTEIFGRPIYNHVLRKEDCLSEPARIMKLDMKTLTTKELEMTEACFNFTVTTSGVMHGFGSWFEVEFGSIPDGHDYSPVTLSTSPWKPYVRSRKHAQFGLYSEIACLSFFDQSKLYSMSVETRVDEKEKRLTHWKQDLMMMDAPITLIINDRIEGKITITRNKVWRRHLRISISFYHISEGTQSNEYRKEFKLWR